MTRPNQWRKKTADTPKDTLYDRRRRLEREILQALAVPRAAFSYASLLAQIDPAKTGDGATILNASIACGHVSRGERKVRITERGRSALQSLAQESKNRGRLPKAKG